MKKFFFIQVICFLACCMPAYAVWNTDATANFKISKEGDRSQTSVIAHETADGKIFVSWLQWADGMNAYIKLQLLDKDGNPLFEDGGIYVSKHQTPTWTGGYDMKVTPDGCAVIAHSDARNDDTRQAFEPYVYKIDQEGNFLWGLDGVALPTMESDALRPQIGVTNKGNVIVGYNDLFGENNSCYSMMKVNEDGTLGWAMPLHLDGIFGCFAPCGEDDLYLSIIQNGALNICRYDSYGEEIWNLVVDKRDINARTEIFPISDGKGGIFLPYQRYINQSVFYTCLQHVSAEGEFLMGLTGLDLSTELAQHSSAGIGVNPKREELVAYWDMSLAGTSFLNVQKFSYYGDPVWDTEVHLDSMYMWGYASADGILLDDGSSILIYGDYKASTDIALTVRKIDNDGKPVWCKQLGVTCSMGGRPKAIFDAEEVFVFWNDSREEYSSDGGGSIYGQNIYYADGSTGKSEVKTLKADVGMNITFDGSKFNVAVAENGMFYLYTTSGMLVKSVAVKAGTTDVLANVPAGIYIAGVTSGSQNTRTKVIIK